MKTRREGYRPLVYICSPFAGDTAENIKRAERFCRFAVDRGCIPLAPHLLYPRFMKEPEERENALFMGMVLLGKCDEVWVLSDCISDGMKAEIALAEKRRQTIKYFDFKEVNPNA